MSTENMCVPAELYAELPVLLRDTCKHFSKTKERDAFLLSAITMAGAVMRDYSGTYNSNRISPTLYCYIINNGIYKGPLTTAYLMGNTVEDFIKEGREFTNIEYNIEMTEYKRNLRRYRSGFSKIPPDFPKAPVNERIYISTRLPQLALMRQLKDNKGCGVIFETDGETIAAMPHSRCEQIRHLLAKGYRNEPIRYYELIDGDCRIEKTAVPVILSGTLKQMLTIIPSAHTGLYNSFCYYDMSEGDCVSNPFSDDFTDPEACIEPFREYLEDLYLEHGNARFCMTEQQQDNFTQQYATDDISIEHNALQTHKALTCYRIAMILTMLRYIDEHKIVREKYITCTDTDLQHAIALTDVYCSYHGKIYTYLQQYGRKPLPADKNLTTDEELEQAYELHLQGMSLRKISTELYGDESKFMKIKRMLKKYGVS